MHEFGCGPPSNRHVAGSPGFDEAYHRYHAVRGGFLSVTIKDGQIAFRHHNVRGDAVYVDLHRLGRSSFNTLRQNRTLATQRVPAG